MHNGYNKSEQLFNEAKQYIPGGVNSPVRAFKSVGNNPVFIDRANGSKICDVDGNEYIDYVASWGPMVLGHQHPAVVEALKTYLNKGTSYGAPTELETEMAKMIIDSLPAMEMVRMVNSGTEATMSALRLARGYTGKNKIVKFEGCYHGHADPLLIKAGSGALTLGVPTSPGVPEAIAGGTITAQFNDLETLQKIFELEGNDIAAVIVEPVAGNMGVVPPAPGFLEGIHELTKKYGGVFICDEVMTGFRVAYGGAQVRFNIEPDLTCLGKIIGGGLPVGAFGGKKEIMEKIAPVGPIYQAGTLSGNPLAMTAGIATLKELQKAGTYEGLEKKADKLAEGLADAAKRAGAQVSFNRVGSMLSTFFTDQQVIDFNTVSTSDTGKFGVFFSAMLAQGIYLAPSQFEAGFVSLAHTDDDIAKTVEAAFTAFKATL